MLVIPDMKDLISDEPGLAGPDYVALVIEWDQLADSIENAIEQRTRPLPQAVPRPRVKPLRALIAIGMLGAITFAAWGVHRLRAA